MIKKSKIFVLVLLGFALGAGISLYVQVYAGSLTPPGTPASTMNALSDITGSGFSTSVNSLTAISASLTAVSSSVSTINSSVSNISIDANSMTANNGMYNNKIIAMNPPAAYTEVCFKNSGTTYDSHTANAATGGGNCSVGDTGYIIEQAQRSAQYWTQARQICLQYNMRLPEAFEWQLSCNNAGTWSMSTMTTVGEWAGNTTIPTSNITNRGITALRIGDGGCNYGSMGWVAYGTGTEDSLNFRCAR